MKTTLNRIEEIKTNGYQLDFGNVFNHAFENYKKIALYAGLVLFVFMVLFIVVIAGIVVCVYGLTTATENFNPENLNPEKFKPENLSGVFLVGYVLVLALFTALVSPFNAGFLKMADCADKDEAFNVATIFSYYKAPFFKEIFTALLYITLVTTSISASMEVIGFQFFGVLLTVAISFFTLLTIPLIVFGNLNAIDAIKSSASIVIKQPLIIILLVIVAAIGSMVGFIGCCIGVFFTIPFMTSMYYAIYCAIVGIEENLNPINDTEN